MKVCLGAPSSRKFLENEYQHCKYMLDSFYSIQKWLIPIIKKCEFFMLDSGAFTFINNFKGKVDFDEYLTQYINFINENDIEHFFELDIDSVAGIEEVERLRKRLEDETGKKSIPVWHKSRGKQYFIDMCNEYEYVSIGGIVTKEIKPRDYKDFRWFIDAAHDRGCKIHGLGFTNLKGMKIYNFDSVDSTSWTFGSKFGALFLFDGQELKRIDSGNGRRSGISAEKINRHNYYEWLKFQQYADTHY